MRVRKYSLCEVFVRRVLPSLRMLLAEELVVRHGFTQLEAAKTLGISQPLINYYLRGRRRFRGVEKLLRVPGIKRIVECVAKTIAEERSLGNEVTSNIACMLCKALRESLLLNSVLKALGIKEDEVRMPAEECIEGEGVDATLITRPGLK